MRNPRRDLGGGAKTGCIELGCDMGLSKKRLLWCGFVAITAVDDAEHDGDEEQRSDSGKHQAADHCAAKRCVLFAAFAKP